MLEKPHIHRLRAVLAIQMAVIVALVLFNVWLLKRPLHRDDDSLADDKVFRSAITELHRKVDGAMDLRTMLAQKPFKLQESGIATWYGDDKNDKLLGQMTASGLILDDVNRVCAHRTLPFGTLMFIFAVQSGKTSYCLVQDRGPFGATVAGHNGTTQQVLKMTADQPGTWNLVADLSQRVAIDLGIIDAGSAQVLLFY